MATLETFSGSDAENIRHWLRSVDSTAKYHGWTDLQKTAAACALLTDRAVVWLDSERFQTWQDFCDAATLHFGRDFEVLLHNLMHVKQAVRESVKDYSNRINSQREQHAHLSAPVPSALLLKFFMAGLLPLTQQKVKDRRPENLDEAVGDAVYFAEMMAAIQLPVDHGHSSTSTIRKARLRFQGKDRGPARCYEGNHEDQHQAYHIQRYIPRPHNSVHLSEVKSELSAVVEDICPGFSESVDIKQSICHDLECAHTTW